MDTLDTEPGSHMEIRGTQWVTRGHSPLTISNIHPNNWSQVPTRDTVLGAATPDTAAPRPQPFMMMALTIALYTHIIHSTASPDITRIIPSPPRPHAHQEAAT